MPTSLSVSMLDRIPARPGRPQRRGRRALAAAYPLGVALAIVATLALGRRSGGSVVALALGLFAALLTAFTLVILLTLDVDSRWPSLQDVIDETYLTRWFLLTMSAITLAAFVDDAKAKWLTTVAIVLSLVGGMLGSLSLLHLLRISRGQGRQYFLGQLLWGRVSDADTTSLPQSGDAADRAQLAAFLARFQSGIDAGDMAALRERVAELAIASDTLPLTSMRTMLATDLRVLRELGRAVLLGRLDSPDVGVTLLPRLGELVVDHAASLASVDAGAFPEGKVPTQIASAAYVGQAARMFAWISAAGYSEAVEKGHAPPALRASAAGAMVARDHILDAVDPESAPATSTADRWPNGLVDPASALVWWWCFCDLNGTHDGRAFYAATWMLTGEKFYGTFGWGDRFLLSELDDRLKADSTSAQSEQRIRSRGLISELGGLRFVALELFATSMATWRDRRTRIPAGLEQNWSYWEDPRRLARRARLFLPRSEEPWIEGADDALNAAGALLSRGGRRRSLGALVDRCFAPLPMVPMPPTVELQRRSAAVVLAIGAHLAPRGEDDSSAKLNQFLRRLPRPLLVGAVSLGQAILHVDEAPATSHDPVRVLIELLAFLQHDQQAATP